MSKEIKVNDHLVIRAVAHYIPGSEFELIGYAPILVKVSSTPIAPPRMDMSNTVLGVFKNNFGASVICYVHPGKFLSSEMNRLYATEDQALKSIE